jgi:hypothetical protein
MYDQLIKFSILGLSGLSLLSIDPLLVIARSQMWQLRSTVPENKSSKEKLSVTNGLIQVKSNFSIQETTTRIESLLKKRSIYFWQCPNRHTTDAV